MYRILLVLLLFPSSVGAGYTVTEAIDQFSITPIEIISETEWFVGELTGWPHTYQFAVTETTPLTAQVAVGDETGQQTSLIVIKEEKRGVSEVGRRTGKDEVWGNWEEPYSGITMSESALLYAELEPGMYRLEISSPDNTGRYLLKVGEGEPEIGYFAKIGFSKTMHSYFGSGSIAVVTSKYILLPALLIVGLFGYVYYRRRYL